MFFNDIIIDVNFLIYLLSSPGRPLLIFKSSKNKMRSGKDVALANIYYVINIILLVSVL